MSAQQNVNSSFDSLSRLVEVRYPGKVIHYTYDGAGNRTGQTVEIPVAAPSITNLSPNSATIGDNAFTLTVSGQNFTNNSIVQWNGANHLTNFLNVNQLAANIPASDIYSIGTAVVTVLDQPTDSVSNTQFFTVHPIAGCVPVSVSNSLSVAGNSTIRIPVSAGDLTNKGVDSYDFILNFNPNVIRTLASAPVDTAGTLSSNFNVTANTATAGQLRVTAFGTASLAGSESLLNLNFEAVGANGSASDLTWTQFQFNEGDPCSTAVGGHVSVTGAGSSISGSVTYGIVGSQGLKYVPNAALTAAGTPQITTSSNFSGAYLLTGLGSGSYTVTPSKTGDVNSISGFDASLVARKAAGLIILTPNQLIAADASNNGTISGFDASLIARTAAGVTNNGIAGQWKFVPASKNYSGLISDQTAQDYEVVLMGEVSGNWTAPASLSQPQYLSETDRILADRREEEAYGRSTQFSVLSAEKENTIEDSSLPVSEKPRFAQAGTTVAFPANATAAKGTTVLIPITVGDTTGQGIFAFDLTVAFDQNVLQPASPAFDTAGTRAGAANFSVTPNAGTPGKLSITAFSSDQPLSGSGTLINLRFNVVGTAGTTAGMTNLGFDSFMFNEGDPAAMTINGSFTVMGTTAASVSVGGKIITAGGRGIAGAKVNLTDDAGETKIVSANAFGYYRFSNVSVGRTYIMTVSSKRGYQFTPQILNIMGESNEINFTALP